MRARNRLRDLVAEYEAVESFNSAMDAAEMLDAFVRVSKLVIAEDDQQRTDEGDQAWTVWERDEDGAVFLDHDNGVGQWQLVGDDDPWRPQGPVYEILRAIYGGDPGEDGR